MGFCLGVDPKSILCEFYKVGQCAKGFKCKFSHDLNVQRKGEKIDIYSDKRDEGDWYFGFRVFCLSLFGCWEIVGKELIAIKSSCPFLCSLSNKSDSDTFWLLLRNNGGLGSRDAWESCGIEKERI